MVGKEKIEAAFSRDGTPEIPAVICYEMLFVRDHWKEFNVPWWYSDSPDIEQQMCYRREVINAVGAQDWIRLWQCKTKIERNGLIIENRADGIYQTDTRSGIQTRLKEPTEGGDVKPFKPPPMPETADDVDGIIPPSANSNASLVMEDGRAELAISLVKEYGKALSSVYYVHSPLWHCYAFWGFDGMKVPNKISATKKWRVALPYMDTSLNRNFGIKNDPIKSSHVVEVSSGSRFEAVQDAKADFYSAKGPTPFNTKTEKNSITMIILEGDVVVELVN